MSEGADSPAVLEFLFGPWQKDRHGQDDRQHHPRHQDAKTQQQQQRSSRSRGPRAATWPEAQQRSSHGRRRGAAARPKTRRAAHRRTCSAHLTALNSRWRTYISALGLARGGALLAENRARKTQKLFLLNKNPLSVFATGNVMRTAVFVRP